MVECFDPVDLESRPTESQQEVLDEWSNIPKQYVLGGNQSGKTQLGAKVTSLMFEENHPNWERPLSWGDEPLLIIVLGRTTKQIEDTIWKKIKALLTPGCWKPQYIGGVIQKVTNLHNGNTILFLSHHAENEAREKVQSFVAHFVWLDEMPGSFKLVEELHRRVQARRGYFLATFTPKVVNSQIRRLVDNSEAPYAKKYKLKAFDNPIYSDEDKVAIHKSLQTASASYRATVLEGDWAVGEEQVYYFDYETMVERPTEYDPHLWRHVECVDPALKSKLGFTLWAEDPHTHIWYCVKAEYVSNIFVPAELVVEMQKKTKGFNIVRRICDPHESWYLGSASAAKVKPAYMYPHNKNSRKAELIKNFQQALGAKIKIAPWCEDFISEIQECRWSDRGDNKIVNASSYHLLDTAQYFTDLIPAPSKTPIAKNWDSWLYQGWQQRKKQEAATRMAKRKKPIRIRRRR
jgi:phage terminase large subunit-like protein